MGMGKYFFSKREKSSHLLKAIHLLNGTQVSVTTPSAIDIVVVDDPTSIDYGIYYRAPSDLDDETIAEEVVTAFKSDSKLKHYQDVFEHARGRGKAPVGTPNTQGQSWIADSSDFEAVLGEEQISKDFD